MTDENIAVTIAADPKLKKLFKEKLEDPSLYVPEEYEQETLVLLRTQVSLVADISSPEDYKTLIQALSIIKAAKERVAVIVHHLKCLDFKWERVSRVATRHIEMTYYGDMNRVKDSIRKAILASALEPVNSIKERTTYLLELAELARAHLNDVNWAIKHSVDIVTNYFNTVRSTSTPRNL